MLIYKTWWYLESSVCAHDHRSMYEGQSSALCVPDISISHLKYFFLSPIHLSPLPYHHHTHLTPRLPSLYFKLRFSPRDARVYLQNPCKQFGRLSWSEKSEKRFFIMWLAQNTCDPVGSSFFYHICIMNKLFMMIEILEQVTSEPLIESLNWFQ